MKNTAIGICSCTLLPTSLFAAAMEKSDQNISAFLEPNHYIELSIATLDAQVSAQVSNQEQLQQLGITDFSTGNLINDYLFLNGAFKLQIQPQFSFGIIYDQPFEMNVSYQYAPHSLVGNQLLESAKLKFNSHNITSLLGYQPTKNWNMFGGVNYQTLQGEINFSGASYSVFDGYEANFRKSTATGWLTGLSYQIPKYAFKSTLTYRSAIKHNVQVNELVSGEKIIFAPSVSTEIKTPQSVNLDFQVGLNENNLFYSSFRWVNWRNFDIQPTQFGAVVEYAAKAYPEYIQKFNLIDYRKDQRSAKIGIAHKFTEQWMTTLDASLDSGSGNSAATFSPSDGYSSLALGAIYNFSAKSFISTGIKYFKFNKAKINATSSSIENKISTFSNMNNNYALAYGFKIGHRF